MSHPVPSESEQQSAAFTRRNILTTSAAAVALAALPRVARAATAPQTQAPAGAVVASLNGTWDFMPTTGVPTTPPGDGGWSSIPVPAEWNMTSGNFNTSWDAYDLFETPAAWDSVDV